MDLRQLRYFLVVAEEGSVAAASRRLHIAQPALSRHMQALEMHVGTPLLERKPRGVSLTDAGKELVASASRVLDAMRDLDERMASYRHGLSGDLHVGIAPSYSWLPILRKIFDRLGEIGPNLRVHLQAQMSADQLESIRKSTLDCGMLLFRPALDEEFSGFTIFQDRWGVAVPKSVAEKYKPGGRFLEELRHEPFIMFPQERAPAVFAAVSQLFHHASFRPIATHTAAEMSTMMGLVSSGVGCAIVPESYKKLAPEDVVIYQLLDPNTHFDFELVWRTENNNLLLGRFIEAAQAVLADQDDQ